MHHSNKEISLFCKRRHTLHGNTDQFSISSLFSVITLIGVEFKHQQGTAVTIMNVFSVFSKHS